MQRLWLLAVIGAVGCESMRPAPQQVQAPSAPVPSAPLRVAAKRPEPPAKPVEILRASASQPTQPHPQTEDDPLSRVAECLARDDHRGAAAHLEGYVRANPGQHLFRLQLAELYLRGANAAEAKFHYERFVDDVQSGPPALRAHLVTAHIKLLEIARHRGDTFGELLHRGAGLLLLVGDQDGTKERDEVFCEEMLCKALKALTGAKDLKPADPRPRALLAEVYDRTGNPRGARVERAAARADLAPTGRKPLLAE